MPSDQDDPRAMFAAFTAELTQIAAGIEDLGGLICDHVRQCPPEARPQAQRDAQAVDVLTQRLAALAALAGALSQGESVRAALRRVPLADMAERLAAQVLSDASAAAPEAVSGELMLFD